MHHPIDRIEHTTAFVTRVVEHWLEREIAQWVDPMKDRSDDPSHHERTLLPRSYISLPGHEKDPVPRVSLVLLLVSDVILPCVPLHDTDVTSRSSLQRHTDTGCLTCFIRKPGDGY